MPTRVTAYPNIFNRHLEETRRHLQGTTPQMNSTEIFVIGSVRWTQAEIDAFFHALVIHSCFRQDLISACVKSKNVLEVVEYLDLLEQGSEKLGRRFSDKSQTPQAYEMSTSWISWEERHAEFAARPGKQFQYNSKKIRPEAKQRGINASALPYQ